MGNSSGSCKRGAEGGPARSTRPRPPGGASPTVAESKSAERFAGSGEGGTGAGAKAGQVVPEGEEAFVPVPVSLGDSMLIKAAAHHGTPFAVADPGKEGFPFLHVSRLFAQAMGQPASELLGKGAVTTISKALPMASAGGTSAIETAIRDGQELTVVLRGAKSSGSFTQVFVTPAKPATEGAGGDRESKHVYALLSLTTTDKEDASPSCSMPYRFRRASECLTPSDVWSLFTPYKQLCQTDQRMVDTLQERQEMFCITDPAMYDNPIVFVSDDFVDMTGYTREEINGINCRFLQGEMTSQEDVDVIRYGIREEVTMRVCLLNYRKNGTSFINQFNMSPLRDVDGRTAFFIGVQMEVEDAEILPFPTTRMSMREMLLEEEYMDAKSTAA